MTDKTQPEAAEPQLEGYQVDEPEIATNAAPEDKARTTSMSPPPEVPTTTKPSALAGQSTANSDSASPAPEARPAEAVPTQNEPADPQVASLKAIFPDYDDAVLQSVLESVNGNQDQAIDLLLGMSDPNFKSEAPPPAPAPQMVRRSAILAVRYSDGVYYYATTDQTQEELDEQLARRLMLEEQQQMQQWRQQNRPQRRSSRMQAQQQAQQQTQQPTSPSAGGKDTMTELSEQFSKYAEMGKKNFGSFVSKVKAKIQEFDKPGEGDASGSGSQPPWATSGGTSYYDSNTTSQPPPRTNYQQYHGPHAAGGLTNPLVPTNTAISQPAAFYDPNPSPPPMSPLSQSISPPVAENRLAQSCISAEGYEVEPIPSSGSDRPASGSAVSSQPAQPTAGAATASVPQRGPSPANPIDGGKLGLLPKRPISLIRDPPQAQPSAHRQNSDDDALEYAENPFDEDRK
ncbi:hypothetical protein NP233_g8303 [Leucocoprinus birnbaumii]|uniref:CUE domain-containing protein n=1 Tax=Leucocoprinus birnbaumii TaxID=56174 RepID=A0AAD5YP70_9AGAR|nr:hypothetical protein NP233_g8303 [Leucocoprinus birnbaumii]